MPSVLSFLGPAAKRFAASTSAPSSQHLTDAPDIPRTRIGPASQHLQNELLSMYWAGVRRELPYIILTLRRWQTRDEFSKVTLSDEEDDLIHGYDTFLDQVSHSSRKFTERNDALPTREEGGLPTYTEALENRGWDIYTEFQSQQVRDGIRTALQLSSRDDDQLRRRARLLLQAAQWLDIDKIIEYRDPEKLLSFWKRPAPPQLKSDSCDEFSMPVLTPQMCSHCQKIIRGSMFKDVDAETIMLCEACYRQHYYGQPGFAKMYKKCCLAEVVTPQISRQICCCPTVEKRDPQGGRKALWPIDNKAQGKHLAGGHGKINCGITELTELVAEAKYKATRLEVDKEVTLEDVRREETAWIRRLQRDNEKADHPVKLPNVNIYASPEFGSNSFGLITETIEDIPIYLRSITDKYPYGNVHMALRLGPLIIENGVAHTHGGVLVTSRDPPELQVLRDPPADIEHSLVLNGRHNNRELWSQNRPRRPKRYKAMMKQVVGGAFSSYFDQDLEAQIVTALVDESRNLVEEGLSASEKATLLEASTERLMAVLRQYLSCRIEAYVASIVARLLDPKVNLRWDFRSNNCQAFCDNLIDQQIFGPLFSQDNIETPNFDHPLPPQLYLMSFVCRADAYVKERANSKFDVPNGLTEEYLLKFRYGRHEESDIIDSLAEYWHDWGGFEGHLYPYQDVFPWDCTEAYERYPIKCGDCNIAKHAWAFPFDSWSILSFHLARGRQLYPRNDKPVTEKAPTHRAIEEEQPSSSDDEILQSGHMTDVDWFHNRMKVLMAQESLLTGAAAMARSTLFRQSTLWLTAEESVYQDRLKLGGIHRAQPFSHHFEKGAFHQFYVADWASLKRNQRVEAYEKLRDWRAGLVDVEGSSGNDGSGCGGGCGGFLCGALMAGCTAGCDASGGDSCGSGCVSSCSSCGGSGCGGCGGCGGG